MSTPTVAVEERSKSHRSSTRSTRAFDKELRLTGHQKRPILLNRFFVGRLGKNTPQSPQEIRWQAIEVENVSVRTALEHSGVYEPRQSSASRLLRMKGVC